MKYKKLYLKKITLKRKLIFTLLLMVISILRNIFQEKTIYSH
ncbi:unknown protein [Cronobacter turicensis z3032]|uniref:Uncharacterized protein n=1 Tax=Cronobacter turicensis (strain DSM 18703 / CCUG 55852 / LMG 23827 / z3032) TaxID=693216 RepID=C9XYW1_CROTZ|nr:unknown protein [Cronobacter turicensis z3032]